MKPTEEAPSWVVYRMTLHGTMGGRNAVCLQSEWEAMERERPGYHILIQADIASEGAAEQLARISPLGNDISEATQSNLRSADAQGGPNFRR
jgi:hypothetical protein